MNGFVITLDAMVCILSVVLFQHTAITIYAFTSLVSDMIASYMSTYRSRMIQSTSLVFATIATIWHTVMFFLLLAISQDHADIVNVLIWYVVLATAWRIYWIVEL
jgi:hypothetical protein